jgi:hypothetical protein
MFFFPYLSFVVLCRVCLLACFLYFFLFWGWWWGMGANPLGMDVTGVKEQLGAARPSERAALGRQKLHAGKQQIGAGGVVNHRAIELLGAVEAASEPLDEGIDGQRAAVQRRRQAVVSLGKKKKKNKEKT